MKKYYSIPGSLAATLHSERAKYPIVEDVDFGKAYTFEGRLKKALKAGYKKVMVSIDLGGEIVLTTIVFKEEN